MRIISRVEAPGAVEIENGTEAGGIDGLYIGAGDLRMNGRGLRVDFRREDGNGKANNENSRAQNPARPWQTGKTTIRTQTDPRRMRQR